MTLNGTPWTVPPNARSRVCHVCDVAWLGDEACWLCGATCPTDYVSIVNAAGPNPEHVGVALGL